MIAELTPEHRELCESAAAVCARFDENYWADKDRRKEFPREFLAAIAAGGWLGMLVPEEYGGGDLGLLGAAAVMETVAASGAGITGATVVNMALFPIQPLVVYGSPEQKAKYLPRILSGELQAAFGVTEPDAGTDTTRIRTFARRDGDVYVVSGQKTYISKMLVAHKVLLLTRTTPYEQVTKKTDGMTLLFADVDRTAIEIRPMGKLGVRAVDTSQLFIDNLTVPVADRIGEEGRGFHTLLDGINPERVLLAAEAIGTARAALRRAVQYAKDRIVFGRPIGANQAIQFPLAEAHAALEAATLMVRRAAWLYDQKRPCGAEANLAKLVAAEAACQACDVALQVHGGAGYVEEFHVERYWRETRLVKLAPVSQEMVKNYVAQKVLGLPRSY
ncbi:MAG: acyl-CoA/acyl-ACP dehydrogenase [Deltaproteobacteria bacterium]|nr:acyl-CoA/acyl-ACP dehydrogenase [Deltaproteobacteria bacterium]